MRERGAELIKLLSTEVLWDSLHPRALYIVCPKCFNPMEIHGRFAICRVCGYRTRIDIKQLYHRPQPA